MTIVLLAVAGGLGASARFLVDTVVARHNRLPMPVGVLLVNVSACFLLGMLTGWTITHPGHDGLRTVLGVGFLGGYSTFSTASVEAAFLLLGGRGGYAVLHPLVMLLAGLGAAVVGMLITG